MNHITIIGNLVKDPELSFTEGGSAKATFTVATSRTFTSRGREEKETVFLDVLCWREQAENVASSLEKGHRVMVTGRLNIRSWEDQDGSRHQRTEIHADEIGPSLRWVSTKIERNP